MSAASVAVSDVTNSFRAELKDEIGRALDALVILNEFFGRETRSIALAEISETLVAKYTGATRTKRNKKGHDLVAGDQRYEVKSRLLSQWGDGLKFDFSRHTAEADVVFCIAWADDESGRPYPLAVFQLPVKTLIEHCATPSQPKYCARTTLGKLIALACVGPEGMNP